MQFSETIKLLYEQKYAYLRITIRLAKAVNFFSFIIVLVTLQQQSIGSILCVDLIDNVIYRLAASLMLELDQL